MTNSHPDSPPTAPSSSATPGCAWEASFRDLLVHVWAADDVSAHEVAVAEFVALGEIETAGDDDLPDPEAVLRVTVIRAPHLDGLGPSPTLTQLRAAGVRFLCPGCTDMVGHGDGEHHRGSVWHYECVPWTSMIKPIDRIHGRLADLASLVPGWFTGRGGPGGAAIAPQTITFARESLTRLFEVHPDLPFPRLYPTPEGEVQAEWAVGRVVADMIFQPDTMALGSGVHLDHRDEDFCAAFGAEIATDAAPLAAWLRGVLERSGVNG